MVGIVSSSTRKVVIVSSAVHRLEVAVPMRPTQWHVIIVRLRHTDPALFDVMSPLNQSFSVHHVCTRPIVALSSHALTKMLPRIRLTLRAAFRFKACPIWRNTSLVHCNCLV